MVKKEKNQPKKDRAKSLLNEDYIRTLVSLKQQIQDAQIKATLAANKELIKLYWSIGKTIAEKQEVHGWGTKIVEQLAKDLQNAFPGLAGFSRTNVFRMKAFFLAYQIVPQAVGLSNSQVLDDLPIFKIPWGHNAVILEKIKNVRERLWYAEKAIENGWSRSHLDMWIKSNLYKRDGKAITNFHSTLQKPQSDLAQQSLKDPYLLDFLTLDSEYIERHLEQGLIDHIQQFLIELGQGFAFVGRQYHVVVSGKDYYIDLLFYNFKLHCFVVVELKAGDFIPEYAGKVNFYLSAIDKSLRSLEDQPTIGLILCKTKDNLTVEYALQDLNKPIGVSAYETMLVTTLPKNLKGSLPTIEEIEAELEKQKMLAQENIKHKKNKFKK